MKNAALAVIVVAVMAALVITSIFAPTYAVIMVLVLGIFSILCERVQ
jgi:hypothetical protein